MSEHDEAVERVREYLSLPCRVGPLGPECIVCGATADGGCEWRGWGKGTQCELADPVVAALLAAYDAVREERDSLRREVQFVTCPRCGAGNPKGSGFHCRMCGALLDPAKADLSCAPYHDAQLRALIAVARRVVSVDEDGEAYCALCDAWVDRDPHYDGCPMRALAAALPQPPTRPRER